MRDFIDDFFPLFVVVLLMVVLSAVIVPIVYWAESVSCSAKWSESGIEATNGFFEGCRVNVGGEWLPEDNYRVVKP